MRASWKSLTLCSVLTLIISGRADAQWAWKSPTPTPRRTATPPPTATPAPTASVSTPTPTRTSAPGVSPVPMPMPGTIWITIEVQSLGPPIQPRHVVRSYRVEMSDVTSVVNGCELRLEDACLVRLERVSSP